MHRQDYQIKEEKFKSKSQAIEAYYNLHKNIGKFIISGQNQIMISERPSDRDLTCLGSVYSKKMISVAINALPFCVITYDGQFKLSQHKDVAEAEQQFRADTQCKTIVLMKNGHFDSYKQSLGFVEACIGWFVFANSPDKELLAPQPKVGGSVP